MISDCRLEKAEESLTENVFEEVLLANQIDEDSGLSEEPRLLVKRFLFDWVIIHVQLLSGSIFVIILVEESGEDHFEIDQLELLRLAKKNWVLGHESVPFDI